MPYEIPQNLKYKEKIAFGLTFWQLFWLGLFGGLSAVIFFRLELNFFLKAFLVLFFVVLGVGFAFFDFFGFLQTYNNYRKGVRKAGFFDKQLNDFVEVKKIEDNVLFLRNNSLRAVLEVTPINFSILSVEEQRAVISAYKDFLNSLDFPVQIVVRTVSLNLDDYLFDLRKNVFELNNLELEKQFESFKDFIQGFIEENSVKNRLFYVVVPFSLFSRTQPLKDFFVSFKNLFSKEKEKTSFVLNKEIALNQLNVRVGLCAEKLKACGLFVRRLENEELFGLLASFFDSFIESKNNYFFPLTLLEKFCGEANEEKEE